MTEIPLQKPTIFHRNNFNHALIKCDLQVISRQRVAFRHISHQGSNLNAPASCCRHVRWVKAEGHARLGARVLRRRQVKKTTARLSFRLVANIFALRHLSSSDIALFFRMPKKTLPEMIKRTTAPISHRNNFPALNAESFANSRPSELPASVGDGSVFTTSLTEVGCVSCTSNWLWVAVGACVAVFVGALVALAACV